jgi:tetratricopeptide (TPR) repeat protein
MECGAWEEELELMRTALYICKDKEGLVYAALANSIGCTECERGHVQASHHYIDKSLEIRRRRLPKNHPEIANSLNNYANILLLNLDTGDCEKALRYYMECIDINMECSPDHSDKFLHIPHTNIARLLRVTKDYDGSIRHAELSRQYSVKSLGPGNHFDGLLVHHHPPISPS